MNIQTTQISDEPTELCSIMTQFGSDKGSGHHNYTRFYYKLFSSIREDPINIFELGLGTNDVSLPSNMGPNGQPGASLYGWKHFFPNATVYGADIDRNILFEANRIHTFYCDQGSPTSIEQLWSSPDLNDIKFDIIIEDGLHTFDYNVTFFENSIQKLKTGGVFIIEDISNDYIYNWEKQIEEWRVQYPDVHFVFLNIDNPYNSYDNRLLLAQKIAMNSR